MKNCLLYQNRGDYTENRNHFESLNPDSWCTLTIERIIDQFRYKERNDEQ